MEQLLEKIMSVQSRSDSVNTSLFDKREHIEKLHRTCNLLRKVQVPPVGLFSNCLVQQKVLHPFRKQKWSKGKQKEKVNNQVLFDQGTYDKLLSEAPKFKLITPSILSDRLRVPLFLLLSQALNILFMLMVCVLLFCSISSGEGCYLV
ncbi:uncharacterized protein LOC107619295 isoform X2 [Arachis ipaensis]|uniref:40S ribosomal protein S25 n=1 Tax=Arachis hypogaea TaxID=3818 RepID=A0A444XIK4_ARAHY|nr:uncharacterized protein LOC107619295 isoform X2 [Arachis ipaensis]RYQ89500.1 hypothetical protein Ahy_B09g096107 isoform A [Arachis hypogaea]